MSRRVAAWLAWSLASVSVAMFVASVGLWLLARFAQEVPSSSLGDLIIFEDFLDPDAVLRPIEGVQ